MCANLKIELVARTCLRKCNLCYLALEQAWQGHVLLGENFNYDYKENNFSSDGCPIL